ncbi:MMPL family transporter [Tengunoibacter tsumagoiensis]|uniref:Transporter n=1 Tax=Tengunoibacter tsumagoiensis TaxID=2014871 RepID=A0A401ZTR1_9CHLR|nr:MMPL family transporter [Tengunoibacter tsumagoiensis]GCE10186.1 transporter [Tengunoibacter tsumagoiensis]
MENNTQQDSLAQEAHNPIKQRSANRLGLAYARIIYRVRWPMLLLWLIILGLSLPMLLNLGSVLQGNTSIDNTSESNQVDQLVQQKLNRPGAQLLVVFQAETMLVSDARYQHELQDFITQARSFPHVSSIENGGTGKDGTSTYLVVNFDKNNTIDSQLGDFQKLVPQGSAATPAHAYVAGAAKSNQEYITTLLKETARSKAIALPIALIVLLIVFGSLVAGLMPLLLAITSAIVSLALITVIGHYISTNVFIISVVSITGLGISIDYSLFIVRRFREELARSNNNEEAIIWTIATAGEAILFSGLTVMIGFTGLLVLHVSFLNSFGLGGLIVVGSAVCAALTLLPAILSILGRRVDALRIPFLSRFVGVAPRKSAGQDVSHEVRQSFWHYWALSIMKHPLLVLTVVTLVLLTLGWPIFSLNIGTPDTSALPKGTESRQAYDILSAQFSSFSNRPVEILVQSSDHSNILSSPNLEKVANLTNWLQKQEHITNVTGLLTPTRNTQLNEQQLMVLYSTGTYQQQPALAQFVAATTADDTTLLSVENNTQIDSSAGKALITHLRSDHTAAAQGLRVLVGGYQASSLDFTNSLYTNFPLAIAFILASTFILLAIMFRSILIPLKAIIINLLSIGAAYGVLVFVFQWGNFQSVLNFTPNGFIDSPVPILLFCTLFGLSMDYEVFLLSRIREEWLHTGNNTQAVAYGLEKTGGTITNAALLFLLISASSIFSSLITTQEYGIGLTVAVLIDSTIIRVLLVPATMRLLGKWNWWLPGARTML